MIKLCELQRNCCFLFVLKKIKSFSCSFSEIAVLVTVFFLGTSFPGLITAQTPAFPGAEGYGSYSKGGRGGELIIVSNLNDSGPGSLRDAVEREGPRTILFEVGGIIDLESALIIRDPYITIAGQTAPEPGITIRGHQFSVQTHDVVVRFIRFRPGDYLKNKGVEVDWASLDAVDIGLEDSDDVHDIIFDHCSFSWGMDENIGIWHRSKNITIQNSIISEGLDGNRLHDTTGKALLIGLSSDNISILKNLFAHNYERNPFMNANGHLDFRNNIIYNGGDRILRFNSGRDGKLQTINLVNNVIIEGPDSKYHHEVQIRLNTHDIYHGKIYADGNISDRNPRFNKNNWKMVVNEQSRKQFPASAREYSEFQVKNTETLPAEDLFDILSPDIGVTLPVRDQVDERIIHDTEHRRGQHISKPEQLFGWPAHDEAYVKIDADSSWRKRYKIDLFSIKEANADANGNGYTNLEEFINTTNPHNDETEWNRIGNVAVSGFTLATTDREEDQSDAEDPVIMQLNYPNPFNSTTVIPFTVQSTAVYKLEVINSTGQRAAILANSTLVPGQYEYVWNAAGFPSGVYFIKLSWPGHSMMQKVVLVK